MWQRPRSLPPFATKRAESALADPKLIHFQTLLVLNREKTRYDKTSQLHLLLKRPGNEADLTVCRAAMQGRYVYFGDLIWAFSVLM